MSDQISDSALYSTPDRYREQHRPQFHFSPETQWMNDPNGLVYFEDEYHLFYQYHPESTIWGPMHWGHAVSEDLIHWKHLPIALYPDSLGYIFSGSVVVDKLNTSGLGSSDAPPLVAIFTHHDPEKEKAGMTDYQYQSIAYSNDKGRTWKKYEQNPVISNQGIKDFRDPKVIWDEQSNKWILVLAAFDKVEFYTSKNLIDWIKTDEFGIEGDDRLWECPDLFPMEVEGSDETKWVLIVSVFKGAPNGGTASSYFIGDFDGNKFSADQDDQKWLDYGTDNYAMVTWNNIPDSDGRRLAMGWMSNWQYANKVPTSKWRGAMTIPRRLIMVKNEEGQYYLRSKPVNELSSLETNKITLTRQIISRDSIQIVNKKGKSIYKLVLLTPHDQEIKIALSNDSGEYVNLGYDLAKNQYFIDRSKSGDTSFFEEFDKIQYAPQYLNSGERKLTLFIDQSSVELFAENGKIAMTSVFFPSSPMHQISLFSEKGDTQLLSGNISELQRIW